MKQDNLNKAILLSGEPIAFNDFPIKIHQPTFAEISAIGEDQYYSLIGICCLSWEKMKSMLEEVANAQQDELALAMIDNLNHMGLFCQFLSINPIFRINFLSVIKIFLPTVEIIFEESDEIFHNFGPIQLKDVIKISIKVETDNEEFEIVDLKDEDLDFLLRCIRVISGLKDTELERAELKPKNALAARIIEKIKKARERVLNSKMASSSSVNGTGDNLSIYVSCLAVGLQLDINVVKKYTIPQLINQYERFSLRDQYIIQLQMMAAGATGVELIEWSKKI